MTNLYNTDAWLFAEPYNTTQMNVKLLEAKIWLKAKQIYAPRVFVGLLTDAFAGVVSQRTWAAK